MDDNRKLKHTNTLNMEITINLPQVASELADLATRREICDNESLDEGDDFWELVYQKDGNGTIYTEKAQDVFNGWYDYYYNEILKYKI